jgi:hypothetical protein
MDEKKIITGVKAHLQEMIRIITNYEKDHNLHVGIMAVMLQLILVNFNRQIGMSMKDYVKTLMETDEYKEGV